MSDWTPDFGTLDGTPPAWAPKRPVRIAVLGDFSGGAARGRLEVGDDLGRRKPIPVEFDTLEDALGRLDVTLTLPIGSGGDGVEVPITELDSFHPDALYREVPVFRALSDLRKRLNNTATFAKAAAEVQSWAGVAKAPRPRRRSKGGAPAADAKLSDFARLVGAASDAPSVRTDGPVDALLKQVVGPLVQKAPDPKRDVLVAAVDEALSEAMRNVLHQPEFQNLEALWRGLDLVLRRIETGPSLQVHLVDISAEEFAADLSSKSDLADTGLYSLLVDKPSQDKAGGYSLVCGLYQFEPTPPHAELLGRMAKIAAFAGAPFITSLATDSLGSRREEPHPLVADAMAALKGLPEANRLALLAPRFLLRHPYGKRSDPISSFTFEEFTANEGLRGMLWGHPALLAACVMAAPGGKTMTIDDLPFHYVVDGDGDQVALPCTERMVNTDTAARLRGFGLSALMAHKGEPLVRFNGLEALDGSPLGLQVGGAAAPRISVTTGVQVAGKAPGATATVRSAPSAKASAEDSDTAEATADADSGGGDDLDALLKSLDGGGDSGGDSAPADAGGGDDDLDALLKSLSDDTPAPAAEGGGGEAPADDAMDPELAALLKSLEG